MNYYQLPSLSALSDFVTVAEHEAIKMLIVNHPKAQAAISLFGAHVLSFKPTDKPEMLWMSSQSFYDAKIPFRGGVPLCWPWFGRINQPAHGFARTSEWRLVEHKESEQGVIICLGLTDNEQTRAIWPHAFSLKLFVEVGERLKISLEITNTDSQAWQWSGALHTYLNLSHIDQASVTQMGERYLDSLQAGIECTGGSELAINQSIDRVYTQPNDCVKIQDKGFERTIHVENSGHNAAVIWNPGADIAKGMVDMPDDGYQTMLCVESTRHATSLDKGLLIEPNQVQRLTTEIFA